MAGATHVRLGPSSEVLIQVSPYLKGEDQRFGSSAIVCFFFFLSLSVVRELCRDGVLWRDQVHSKKEKEAPLPFSRSPSV